MDMSDPLKFLEFIAKTNEAGVLFHSLMVDADLAKQAEARAFEITCLFKSGLQGYEAGMSSDVQAKIINMLVLAYMMGVRDGQPVPDVFKE